MNADDPMEPEREAPAAKIAEGCGVEFWLIRGEVFRVSTPSVPDVWGLPMARRWECSLGHWKRYRACYSWAEDFPATGSGQPSRQP